MKKALILIFGRFNPPTRGHEKLFNLAVDMGEKKNADVVVCLSSTQDDRNPLSFSEKSRYIKRSVPSIIIGPQAVTNPALALTWAHKQGYTMFYLLVGDDRKESFRALAKSWSRNYDTENTTKIALTSVPRTGKMKEALVSGTVARRLAQQGNSKALQKILISGAADPATTKEIVQKIQRRLGPIEELRMTIKGFRHWLREIEGEEPRDPKDVKMPSKKVDEFGAGSDAPEPVPDGALDDVPEKIAEPDIDLPLDATEDDGRVPSDTPKNQAVVVIHPPIKMKSAMINKMRQIRQQRGLTNTKYI